MVLFIGEILVDNIGVKKGAALEMTSTVGGAPFNVASDLASLGINTTFYGRVGNDIMGKFVIDNLPKCESLTSDIDIDNQRSTTLAYFIKDEEGEGRFSFLRNNTADYHFEFERLKKYLSKDIKIAHFGSLCLQDEAARSNLTKLALEFRKQGKLLSFDVNFREDIYKNGEDYKSYYLDFINQSDIVKFSEEEITLLSGKEDFESALQHFSYLKLVFITLGKKGSMCLYKGQKYFVPTTPIHLVDAVGCGDAFYSGVLSYLYDKDINNLSEEDIVHMLKRGNACGALNGLHKGATGAFKSVDEVKKYMEEN